MDSMKHYSTYQSQFIEMFGSASKVSINNLVDTTWGSSPDSKTYNDTGDGVPFYQGKTEFGDLYINEPTTYCTAPVRMTKKHAILMSVRAPVGSVNIATQECCIGRGLASITPKEGKSTTMFVFYALRYMEEEIERLGTGSTFKAINKDSYAKIQMPNVNIEQQQEFVKIAEQADKSKFTHLKSQFIEMFGQVSEDSPCLNDIARVYDGTHKTPTYTESGIPFISVENISDVYGSNKYISNEDYDLYKHKPEYGDIFMTRIGSIGKCAVYESHDPLAYYVSLALIKPNKDIVHPKFLKYYIESTDGALELKKRSLLKAFPMKINLGEIGKIKVIVPAKDKQLEFVKVAEQADKSKLIRYS